MNRPNRLVLLLTVGAVCFISDIILATAPTLDRDGVMVIEGRRRFIIGSYYNPPEQTNRKALAENGFNLVRCNPSREDLDSVRASGLYAWVNTGNIVDFSQKQAGRREKLIDLVSELKSHPRLIAWEVPDEALWNISWAAGLDKLFYGEDSTPVRQDSVLTIRKQKANALFQGLTAGLQELRKLDPNRPIWFNHAPRNTKQDLRMFSSLGDIVGCDIYPIRVGHTGHSDLINVTISSVGDYTSRMQEVGPRQAVWMVLQAFSWQALARPKPEVFDPQSFPSYNESRFMAYDAILNGAKGILYWGSYTVDFNSMFWKSICAVTRELAKLEPFLVAPEQNFKIQVAPITFVSSEPTRIVTMVRHYQDDTLIIILQEDLGQYVDVWGLDWLEGKTLFELGTDRSYRVNHGRMRVWYTKEPHVLCTNKKYEVRRQFEFPTKWDADDNYPLLIK